MSLDGKGQMVPREIVNNKPIRSEVNCDCGGTFYASRSSKYVRCSNGEIRCTVCHREAKRFGKKGYTCGMGCSPVEGESHA